jgi:Ankyrin repeats (3 copies)
LGELPKSLDGTYERILQDINEENWKFALRLFQCVAVASRPLRVDELAEFLAFDFDAGATPTFLAGWRPEDPIGAVLSTCSSLLAVVDVKDLTFIQFSHFSVREFLTSTRLAGANDNISRYHVSMTPAHTIMARACLGILLHLDEEVTNDNLKSFPLAEYASKNWVDHARFDNGSTNTQAAMKRLFDPRRPHLRILVWIFDPEIPWWIRSERLSQPRGTCLHYATLTGLPDLVKFLVTEFSPDLNARGFFDDVTPLHLASRDGHVQVTRVLLEHGADVNARDISKWTPLRHALDEGHVEVARALIKKKQIWAPKAWTIGCRCTGRHDADKRN